MSFSLDAVRRYGPPLEQRVNELGKLIAKNLSDNNPIETDDIVGLGDSDHSIVKRYDNLNFAKKFDSSLIGTTGPLLTFEPDYSKLVAWFRFSNLGWDLTDYAGLGLKAEIFGEPCMDEGVDLGFYGGARKSVAHSTDNTISYKIPDNSLIRILGKSTGHSLFVRGRFDSLAQEDARDITLYEKYDDSNNAISLRVDPTGLVKYFVRRGGTDYQKIMQDYSVNFDGTNDSIACGSDTALWGHPALSKFSFSFWIRRDTLFDANFRDLINHNWGGNNSFTCYFSNANNNIALEIVNIWSTRIGSCSNNRTSAINTWYHVSGVYDSTLSSQRVKLYVDGVNGTSVDTTAGIALNSNTAFTLGGGASDFDGRMRDFRWWTNYALTQEDVDNLRLYGWTWVAPDYWLPLNEGTGTTSTDIISGSKVGTLTNGPTWQTETLGNLVTGVDYDIGVSYANSGNAQKLYVNGKPYALLNLVEVSGIDDEVVDGVIWSSNSQESGHVTGRPMDWRWYDEKIVTSRGFANLWTNKISISNIRFGEVAVVDGCIMPRLPIGDSFTGTSFTTTSFT